MALIYSDYYIICSASDTTLWKRNYTTFCKYYTLSETVNEISVSLKAQKVLHTIIQLAHANIYVFLVYEFRNTICQGRMDNVDFRELKAESSGEDGYLLLKSLTALAVIDTNHHRVSNRRTQEPITFNCV